MTDKNPLFDEAGKPTGVIQFLFDDKSETAFDIHKCSPDILFRLAIHGASQKIGDSYANAKKEANPLAFAKERVKEVIEQLYAGDWRAAATGGSRVSDLAVALSRVTGKSLDDSVAFVETLDDDGKKVWKEKKKIKAALAAIAAEKAAAKAAKLAKAAEAAGTATEGEEEEEEELDFDVPTEEPAPTA